MGKGHMLVDLHHIPRMSHHRKAVGYGQVSG
jgi:hypothetical protein